MTEPAIDPASAAARVLARVRAVAAPGAVVEAYGSSVYAPAHASDVDVLVSEDDPARLAAALGLTPIPTTPPRMHGTLEGVAVGAQHGFDGALPGRVGDFDDFGQRAVADAGFGQAGAEAADFRVARRAAMVAGGAKQGGFFFEGGDGLALLALQVEQAGVGPGVGGFKVDGAVAGLAGQAGAQGGAFGEQLVGVAHRVVGGEVGFFGVEFGAAGGLAFGLGGGFFGFDGGAAGLLGGDFVGALLVLEAASGDVIAGQADVADEFGDFEARHDFTGQRSGFVIELLPFEEAVGLEALGFGLGAQAVEVEAEGGEFAFGVVLLFAERRRDLLAAFAAGGWRRVVAAE